SSLPNRPYSSLQSPEVRSSTVMRCGMVRGRSRNWKACLRLMACSCRVAGQSPALRGAAQGFGEGFDAGRLRFDQPEPADVVAELVEDLLRPDAAGQLAVAADQAVQVLAVVLEAFGRHPMDVDQLMVVAVDEVAVGVQH